MLFLVVLVIALGWAAWFWSWGRDRLVSNPGLGLPTDLFAKDPPSAFGPPRTAAMARRRRREVLGALGLCVLLSLLLARSWSPMWSVHLLADGALAAYAWAVYSLERPTPLIDHDDEVVDLEAATRLARGPLPDGETPRHQPGPRSDVTGSWR